MSKPVRLTLIIVGAIVTILVLGGAAAFVIGGRAMTRTMALPPETVATPNDSASLARGAHLATIWGCVDCHGADLGGNVMIPGGPFAYLVAPNLTTGSGGIGGAASDAALELAIRHGVGLDGRVLMIMPSMEYHAATDEDLGSIIAYVRSVPPVDREVF
ncbi:MAG: c-type cytochrome, partial [Acidobacteriota bacterium]|nr:c-type cytochrome [Acidobacteriota bacterium]